MNTIVAAFILSAVVIGCSMADYAKPAYHAAPAHHAPAPAHYAPAPAHHGHGYGHPVVHAYAAKAPHVKCGANLLVGCAPNVAHVPCVPAHGHAHGYGHAPAPAHHGYRSFSEADQASAFEVEE
ncbi:vitelline membrane protein 15a-2 [Anopheles aquasalis]|uniref:vitelline membrane protein 15a-2 n=1 Tax=Anopheles aquasalis TaxID=42839 RepID=UPI00215B564C|nr:vitelline membrane protein 15a-2 [Anopheles aquasalis]